MKKLKVASNLISSAETLAAVHTSSFIGDFCAIFAPINVVEKDEKF